MGCDRLGILKTVIELLLITAVELKTFHFLKTKWCPVKYMYFNKAANNSFHVVLAKISCSAYQSDVKTKPIRPKIWFPPCHRQLSPRPCQKQLQHHPKTHVHSITTVILLHRTTEPTWCTGTFSRIIPSARAKHRIT